MKPDLKAIFYSMATKGYVHKPENIIFTLKHGGGSIILRLTLLSQTFVHVTLVQYPFRFFINIFNGMLQEVL